MSKKNSKQQARNSKAPSRPWDESEEDQLLAWIDYCREYGVDFHSTVIGHLKASTGHEPSKRRVDDKLKRELTIRGADDCYSVAQLLRRGTREGLPCHKDERLDRIRDIVIQLEPPVGSTGAWPRSGSTSTLSALPSRTASIAPTSPDQPLSANPYSIPVTPELEEPEGKTVAESGYVLRSGRKRSNSAGIRVSKASPLPLRPAKKGRVASQSQVNTSRRKKEREVGHKPEEAFASKRTTDQNPEQRGSEPEHLIQAHHTEADRLRSSLQTKDADILRLKREIFTLQNQLLAARAEHEALRGAVRATEADAGNFETQLILRRECNTLRNELTRIEGQRRQAEWIDSNCFGPSRVEVQQHVGALHDKIRDACLSPAFEAFPLAAFNEGSPLNGWASRALSAYSSPPTELASMLAERDIKSGDLLRALVAAALCVLVFEIDLVGDLGVDSPILSQHRGSIATRYGKQALYQLDLLTIKAIIEETYFQTHLLPTRAWEIAEYICDCLGLKSAETSRQQPEEEPIMTRDDIISDVLSAAEAVQHTVLEALKLHSSVLVSQTRYRFAFFLPGQPFDPETMIREGSMDIDMNDIRRRGGKSKEKWALPARESIQIPIQLCLFPALYVCERGYEIGHDTSSFAKSKFVSRSDSGTEDGFVLLARGLVVL